MPEPQTIFGSVVQRMKGVQEERRTRGRQEMQDFWSTVSAMPPEVQRRILSQPDVQERLNKQYGIGQDRPSLPPILGRMPGRGPDEYGRAIPEAGGGIWDIPKSQQEQLAEYRLSLPPVQQEKIFQKELGIEETYTPEQATQMLQQIYTMGKTAEQTERERTAALLGRKPVEPTFQPGIVPAHIVGMVEAMGPEITAAELQFLMKAIKQPAAKGMSISDIMSMRTGRRGEERLGLTKKKAGREVKKEERFNELQQTVYDNAIAAGKSPDEATELALRVRLGREKKPRDAFDEMMEKMFEQMFPAGGAKGEQQKARQYNPATGQFE